MHTPSNDHFRGKDALTHVAETQAEGILTSAELHGLEAPGHLTATFDAMRETGVLFLFFSCLSPGFPFFVSLTLGFAMWKSGRSALLGWQRLERLHRLVAQEKWEIEHHRSQERAELAELYRAKGFQGSLLEEVLDVLMADNERLLRVMVEEELKLSVANLEHPLKLGLGAFIGTLAGALPFLCLARWIPASPAYLSLLSAGTVVAIAAGALAFMIKNHIIPSVIWNLGLLATAFSFLYFLRF